MKSSLVVLSFFFFFLVVTEVTSLKVARFRHHHHHHEEVLSFLPDNDMMNREMEDGEKDGIPRTCCHSDSLQGTTYTYGSESFSPLVTRFYHDSQNSRLALVSTEATMVRRMVVDCRDQGVCTVADIVDQLKKCTRKRMTGVTLDQFWTRCIPRDATKRQVATMGGDDSPVKVDVWDFSKKSGQCTRIVTVPGCVPVADIEKKATGRQSTYYFNVSSSKIKDKKIFEVPLSCQPVAK